ncbi:MAG: hypothetical protein QOD00_1605 [Blastocatellia bacterium]|jgi:hypothetical protein|nr:hypothetical protein [Blastocatellia bacterium]
MTTPPPSPCDASQAEITDEKRRVRIFISYKREVEPDEPVALQIYESLKDEHDIFIDQIMRIGTNWPARIENELCRSDFLITLLSANSVYSEMVETEIKIAHNLAKSQGGRPVILPVRLDYQKELPYPLSAYLDHINWAHWKNAAETPRLINEIKEAISSGELLATGEPRKDALAAKADRQPLNLARPTPSAPPDMSYGAVDTQSAFYKERRTDALLLNQIKSSDASVTVTIKGARQMGKSSLLVRAIDTAIKGKKLTAFLDFQLIDGPTLDDRDAFFRQFCSLLSDALNKEDRVDDYWTKYKALSNTQRCTRYMSRYLLKEIDRPLVLAMDEVESVFDTEYRSDFFGMLRSWHGSRANPAEPEWKRLSLVMVTSTEPFLFIKDMLQSPFNVGQVITLEDFTLEEVAGLNVLYRSPLDQDGLRCLRDLLGGHPYLVRRALFEIASGHISLDQLCAKATAEDSLFGDHLRNLLFRIHDKEDLIEGLRQVIGQQTCQDELVFVRLHSAGLVRSEGRQVFPRSKLYADYFREHLHV